MKKTIFILFTFILTSCFTYQYYSYEPNLIGVENISKDSCSTLHVFHYCTILQIDDKTPILTKKNNIFLLAPGKHRFLVSYIMSISAEQITKRISDTIYHTFQKVDTITCLLRAAKTYKLSTNLIEEFPDIETNTEMSEYFYKKITTKYTKENIHFLVAEYTPPKYQKKLKRSSASFINITKIIGVSCFMALLATFIILK